MKFLAGGNMPRSATRPWKAAASLPPGADRDASGRQHRDYATAFVNDWGSHLDTLLPTGAFDVGLGWYMPNCEKRDL